MILHIEDVLLLERTFTETGLHFVLGGRLLDHILAVVVVVVRVRHFVATERSFFRCGNANDNSLLYNFILR